MIDYSPIYNIETKVKMSPKNVVFELYRKITLSKDRSTLHYIIGNSHDGKPLCTAKIVFNPQQSQTNDFIVELLETQDTPDRYRGPIGTKFKVINISLEPTDITKAIQDSYLFDLLT